MPTAAPIRTPEEQNGAVTITSNTFVKPGYELAGFYVGNTYYAYGKAVRIRSNITVKASWKACSHPQKQVVSTAATCTRDGKTQVICSKCKQVFSTSTIKGGHKWQITHFGGPNGHDVYCTVCGTTSVQPHTFKYCSRDGRGTHYVECTQCTYFGTQKCRDCIPDSEWEYLVYRGFESGKNLYLRNGFCPVCGLENTECGVVGLLEKTSKLKNVVSVVEACASVAGFVLGFTPASVIVLIQNVLRVRSFILAGKNVQKAGAGIVKAINDARRNTKVNEVMSNQNVGIMEGFDYLSRSDGERNSAKVYFSGSTQNMYFIYD